MALESLWICQKAFDRVDHNIQLDKLSTLMCIALLTTGLDVIWKTAVSLFKYDMLNAI